MYTSLKGEDHISTIDIPKEIDMNITIDSIRLVTADYTNRQYILVNNKYYTDTLTANIGDTIKCNPKTSKSGYTYLNEV